MQCKVEISARHIHLTREDFEFLFEKKEPTNLKQLSQNQFYCEETVIISEGKKEIKNVRLVGPFRDQSQVEISFTDSKLLGTSVPLKHSGEIPGAKIKIIGPVNSLEKEIAIVAKRHLHVDPETAESLGIKNDDQISAEIKSERGLVFNNITVRVSDSYELALNLDTDEGNACGIQKDGECELIIGK